MMVVAVMMLALCHDRREARRTIQGGQASLASSRDCFAARFA